MENAEKFNEKWVIVNSEAKERRRIKIISGVRFVFFFYFFFIFEL